MTRSGATWLLAALGAAGAAAQPGDDGVRLLSSEGLPAEHVALLMSDQQGGDLLFEQVASVVPLDDGTPALGFWLEVDADGLLVDSVPERLFLKLTAYVLRGSSIAFAKSRAIEVTSPGRLLEVDGVRVTGAIRLDPGDYRLRVLVSEPDSGRVGIRADSVRIPMAGETAVSALELAEVDADWLDVALDGSLPPAGFLPSALAVVPSGQTWSARVLVTGARDLAIENGSSLGPEAVTAGAWTFDPGPGQWSVASSQVITAPELSGRFEIAPVAISAGQTTHSTFGDDFVVQQQGEANLNRGGITELLVTSQVAEATSWTRLKRNTAVASAPPPMIPHTARKKLTISKREARERLIMLLAEYAAGESGVVNRLAEFEREAAGGSERALVSLGELELRAFASIQQRQPKAVVPILSLYLRRYRDHLERREYFLSTHCKRVAIGLAEQARSSRDPDLLPALADFLTAMGGLQVAGNDPNGVASLRSALSIDPKHQAALEILTWHLERDGRYEAVVEMVGRTEDAPPSVKLRGALSALRLGRPEAWSELESLSRRPDWIGELATQEMVRRHLAGDNRAAAEAVLADARSRFPDNRKLILLTALLHDLRGQPLESLEAMAALGSAAEVDERHRYASEPTETLDEIRRRLFERARADTASLQQVLQNLT